MNCKLFKRPDFVLLCVVLLALITYKVAHAACAKPIERSIEILQLNPQNPLMLSELIQLASKSFEVHGDMQVMLDISDADALISVLEIRTEDNIGAAEFFVLSDDTSTSKRRTIEDIVSMPIPLLPTPAAIAVPIVKHVHKRVKRHLQEQRQEQQRTILTK